MPFTVCYEFKEVCDGCSEYCKLGARLRQASDNFRDIRTRHPGESSFVPTIGKFDIVSFKISGQWGGIRTYDRKRSGRGTLALANAIARLCGNYKTNAQIRPLPQQSSDHNDAYDSSDLPFMTPPHQVMDTCDGCDERCKLGAFHRYCHWVSPYGRSHHPGPKYPESCVSLFYGPTIGGKEIYSLNVAGTLVDLYQNSDLVKNEYDALKQANQIAKLCANYKTK